MITGLDLRCDTTQGNTATCSKCQKQAGHPARPAHFNHSADKIYCAFCCPCRRSANRPQHFGNPLGFVTKPLQPPLRTKDDSSLLVCR